MGALSSLKILDFSTLLPGPLATMILADLGAQVVSVSAPGKADLMNGYPVCIYLINALSLRALRS